MSLARSGGDVLGFGSAFALASGFALVEGFLGAPSSRRWSQQPFQQLVVHQEHHDVSCPSSSCTFLNFGKVFSLNALIEFAKQSYLKYDTDVGSVSGFGSVKGASYIQMTEDSPVGFVSLLVCF
jgi:hypothetical protein